MIRMPDSSSADGLDPHSRDSQKRFRIAFLVDSVVVPYPIKDLLDWADGEPDIDICALLIHPAPQSEVRGVKRFLNLVRKQGVYVALSRVAFAAMARLEAAVMARAPAVREMLAGHDIGQRVARQLTIHPIVAGAGTVYRFSSEDVRSVTELDLDLLVRGGNGILKGDILSAARHGVLSLHHGDNRINRGGPAGFWEVRLRQSYSGFIVQRLTEELDGGEVLSRGRITTEPFYTRNKAALFAAANAHLKRTIRAVLEERAIALPSGIYDDRLYRTPRLGTTIAYALGRIGYVAGKVLRRATGRRWRWEVAYSFTSWRRAVLWRAKHVPNPKGHFLADPFALAEGGEHYLFVEDYVDAQRKAAISAYHVPRNGPPERIGIVLDEPFHLSFPYLFRFDGSLFMVPESSHNRDIRAYRCIRFPEIWKLETVIMSEVTAVDTMIFEHGGKWWMFTTMVDGPLDRPDRDLHIFYSDHPLGGWKPHRLNPVRTDAEGGRNGGLLRDAGRLFRVAQRHGFARYGQGCSIYAMERLSETEFEETLVQDVSPNFLPGVRGIHHLHQDGELFTFDFVRDTRRR